MCIASSKFSQANFKELRTRRATPRNAYNGNKIIESPLNFDLRILLCIQACERLIYQIDISIFKIILVRGLTMEETLKTGTTTVGIKCKDGIILAADKRATAGTMIVDKRTKKILQVADAMAVTTAGTVSDVQLLVKLLRAEIKLKTIKTGRNTTVKEAANLLAGMVYSNIRKHSMIPGISHFLFAGKDKTGYHLYDVFADGSLTEIEDTVSSGSGSVFAYGVLETLAKKDMSIDEGVKLAMKAVNASLQRDSASGNGIDIIKISDKGYEEVVSRDLNTRLE